MIEDKELRELFKIESYEHLQVLSDGLLKLEKEPKDALLLAELFRQAHSLKGAARMVGAADIEFVAHKFEDILGAAKNNEKILSSEAIDLLYRNIDSIRKLVNEAVTGEFSGVDVKSILFDNDKNREPVVFDQASNFKIDSVRVGTNMLDRLMTQSGELSVTKACVSRYTGEIEEIISRLEERGVNLNKSADLLAFLSRLKTIVYNDTTRLNLVSSNLEELVHKIRLIPISAIFNLFPRIVRDMSKEQEKEIDLIIEGQNTVADKRIIEEIKDPIMHLVRNAIDHGIEKPQERVAAGKPGKGVIRLSAFQNAGFLVIEVFDDGRGLDLEAIKEAALKNQFCTQEELLAMTPAQIEALILKSGFSTSAFVSDISGRGIGLDVVRANVERLKGALAIESSVGNGCKFIIRLPLALSKMRVVIISVSQRKYAVPMDCIELTRKVILSEIFTVAGKKTISFEDKPLSVAYLSEVLELPVTGGSVPEMFCIVFSVENERFGILVDALLDEQEVVLKPQSAILKRVRNVSGAAILARGEICVVLNPLDMLRTIRKLNVQQMPKEETKEHVIKKHILLVEDSITTRTQEKRILENAGYSVIVSVDGIDALDKLYKTDFDAVVADIQMPNMDGLALTQRIRCDEKHKDLPIILVTSLASDEDKKRGMEAGANAYIPKPAFDQQILLDILRRLV